MEDLLERLAHLGSLILIHNDLHSGQRLDEEDALRENGVNVLFQRDIFALSSIIDDTRSRRLGSKLKALEDRFVFLLVVKLGGLLSVFCLGLRRGFFISEGIFEVIVQRLHRIVLGGRRFLFGWLKVGVYNIALGKLWQNLVLLGVVIVLCPTFFENHGTFEQKLLVVAHGNSDLGLLHDTILCAEHGNKATEHGGIYLHLLLAELSLVGDLIRGRQCRVRLDLTVVEDRLRILKSDGIAQLRYVL